MTAPKAELKMRLTLRINAKSLNALQLLGVGKEHMVRRICIKVQQKFFLILSFKLMVPYWCDRTHL